MALSQQRSSELMGRPYIRSLEAHELALARLYDCLGSTLVQASAFWRKLAKEELQHRNIIQVLEEKMEEEGWIFQLPTFKYKDVIDATEWIGVIRERMAREGITMNKALEIAMLIENSILESDFFEIIEPRNSEIKDALQELTEYTEEHLNFVKAEAKKFKWKLLGNKEYKLAHVMDNWETCNDPETKMRAAQSDILELIISLEDAAASLYRTYGQTFPKMSAFWSGMAKDELQHSAMLRKLHESLEQGHLFENIGRFKKEALQGEIQFAVNCEKAALEGGVSIKEALNNAVGVEMTMAEGEFYQTVTSDSESFQIIAKRLVELTKEHIHELQAELEKHPV
jgi:rubrerythrin